MATIHGYGAGSSCLKGAQKSEKSSSRQAGRGLISAPPTGLEPVTLRLPVSRLSTVSSRDRSEIGVFHDVLHLQLHSVDQQRTVT